MREKDKDLEMLTEFEEQPKQKTNAAKSSKSDTNAKTDKGKKSNNINTEDVLKTLTEDKKANADANKNTSAAQARTNVDTADSEKNTVKNTDKKTEKTKDTSDDSNTQKPAESKKKKRRKKRKKSKHKIKQGTRLFWLLYVIYVFFLLGLSLIFLKYTDQCLVEYEATQPDKTMERIFSEFKDSVMSGRLPDSFDISKYVSPYDREDEVKNMFLDSVAGKNLEYDKAPGSYNTEQPEYIIYADGNPIVKVELTGTNERVIFAILTVMDWEISSQEYFFDAPSSDYTFNVPEGYMLEVNGKQLTESNLCGTAEVELFTYAKEYCDLPEMEEYVIEDLKCVPDVKAYDINGNEVECRQDGNTFDVVFGESGDIPEEIYEDAVSMAETWSLFMTKDLSGESNGFHTVAQYLIKDSYYYTMAREYATGIDITFVSAHTLKPETFTNIKVDDYVRYNDNCYSCHIYFEKNMTLKTGRDMVDVTDSTFIFVNYDDTDDGNDNPHWCIVDMIANTD